MNEIKVKDTEAYTSVSLTLKSLISTQSLG